MIRPRPVLTKCWNTSISKRGSRLGVRRYLYSEQIAHIDPLAIRSRRNCTISRLYGNIYSSTCEAISRSAIYSPNNYMVSAATLFEVVAVCFYWFNYTHYASCLEIGTDEISSRAPISWNQYWGLRQILVLVDLIVYCCFLINKQDIYQFLRSICWLNQEETAKITIILNTSAKGTSMPDIDLSFDLYSLPIHIDYYT